MKMSELLPCPFCGCEAEIITAKSIHSGYLFAIMCKYCCSRGDFHHTEEQAIDAWNSRLKSYPESLAQRMIADAYEYELFKLREELERVKYMRGKLTAEQVRKTVEKHWHDLPVEYDMPEATALPEYSYDWQAIANELNTMMGGK